MNCVTSDTLRNYTRGRSPMQYHAAFQKHREYQPITSKLYSRFLLCSIHIQLIVCHPSRPRELITYKITAAWS
jgi:hypothetical protein